jgi:DUF4097 and DUF4098 domain-containing protein YvlB
MTTRRTIPTFITAAVLVAAVATPAAAQRYRDEYASRIDTTIAFARGGTVELQLTNGEIIVTGWSRDQLRVRATSERNELRMDASGSYVKLGLRSGTSRSGDTRFEVSVPVGTKVRATTTSGDIRITGSRGEVEARTQRGDIVVEEVASSADITAFSGDVDVSNVDGRLNVNVLSGDVQVRRVNGAIEVKTVSGEIEVLEARSQAVRVNSTSGDIVFDGTIDAAGRYELATHSGDVDLTLPANINATLTVSTYSGGIESDFRLTLPPGGMGSDGKRFTFTLGGGGGARITAESFSGDINIRSRASTGGRGDNDRDVGGDR